MKVHGNSLQIPVFLLLAGVALSLVSCSFDKDYEITNDKLNMEVTLMEDGVSIPLGGTDKISIGSLLSAAGAEVGDLIKAGENGELSITMDGSTSLSEQLANLDLAKLATMDGFSISESFSYKFKDFDMDDFAVPAEQYGENIQVENVGKISIETKPVAADLDGLGVQAGLDKYKDVIQGNKELDLSSKIDPMNYSHPILTQAEIDPVIQNTDKELVLIPENYWPQVVLEDYNINVDVKDIVLHDDVTALVKIHVAVTVVTGVAAFRSTARDDSLFGLVLLIGCRRRRFHVIGVAFRRALERGARVGLHGGFDFASLEHKVFVFVRRRERRPCAFRVA